MRLNIGKIMSRLIRNEWIPAARELPKNDMHVLVCRKDSREVFACEFNGGHFRYHYWGNPIENIEWWCSFPKAPWYNFESGFGSLNQSLRYIVRKNPMNINHKEYCANVTAGISELCKKIPKEKN